MSQDATFAHKLMTLDAALTGKSWQAVQHNHRARPFAAKDFLPGDDFTERAYYLSDSGYSRLCFNLDSGCLFLTSNSLDAAKRNWSSCKELVADLEEEIKAAGRKDGWFS